MTQKTTDHFRGTLTVRKKAMQDEWELCLGLHLHSGWRPLFIPECRCRSKHDWACSKGFSTLRTQTYPNFLNKGATFGIIVHSSDPVCNFQYEVSASCSESSEVKPKKAHTYHRNLTRTHSNFLWTFMSSCEILKNWGNGWVLMKLIISCFINFMCPFQ